MNEECFAIESGKCNALNKRGCPGYAACGFYKPRWKLEKEQQLLNHRLRSLPREKQMQIADKYYNGKMPWRTGIYE